MKLKLAVILPTLAIMFVLIILALVRPELMRTLTYVIPVVGITGSLVGFFLERSRRGGKDNDDRSNFEDEKNRKVRLKIAIVAAVVMTALLALILAKPDLTLPLSIAFGIVVLTAVGLSLSLSRSSRN